MNDFENKVLEVIAPFLDTGNRAEFFSNTLFVTCSFKTLGKITNTLTEITGRPVDVNSVGSEFSIDFV